MFLFTLCSVSGMAKAFPAIPLHRRQGITDVLLSYLRKSASIINEPVCRQGIQSDAQWLETNLGPFSPYATYSDLKVFNISGVTVLDSLSSRQKAELLLEPNNLSNETLVRLVFTELTVSSRVEELSSFFDKFVSGAAEQNLTTIEPRVRDTLLNLTLLALGPKLSTLDAKGFKLWFQDYLPLFLPSIDSNTFEIIPENITCDSYQEIVKGCNSVFTLLSERQTQQVFTFAMDYLRRNSSTGFSCVESVSDDRRWLEDNFGRFRVHASYMDFVSLKNNFNGVEVADLLTVSQLAELAAAPSQLQTMQEVTKVMTVINPVDFGAFFDKVSPAIQIHQANYTEESKSAFLQAVFDRGNLSSPAVNDTEFLLWLRVRLSPLLVNLSPSLVTPLFDIGKNRSCNSSQEMIMLLDTLHMTLSNNTQKEIYKNTLLFLQGPTPLKCYSGGSFFIYLRNTFLSFGFPDLSMLTSLLPQTRESELLSTISTSELRQFLSQPNVIDNNSDICVIFNNYNNTPAFLETEDVPDNVKIVTLPCVWSSALSSNSKSEVNSWFDLRLRNYLRFLSKSLISSTEVQNASCLAFQKLVSVMGNNFTYNSSDFGQADVYTTIRTYLRTGSGARCYNASDAELNSTSWFVNYIGTFVTFITLDDLTTFISTSEAQVFLEDQANLELFNNTAIPENVTDYYISQLFAFNPTFNPVKLPGLFLCSSEVPSLAYSSVNEADTTLILNEMKKFCNGTVDPEVSAALASNIQTITGETFSTLGSASSGLTNSQITSVPPSVMVSSLSTLGTISTWSQEQATTIIQTISSAGFQLNTGSSLESLGTLVTGVPSKSIENTSASELLSISKNPTFVSNMLTAPTVVQQTFVEKIISVDTSPAKVVLNVPDAMATEIPPSLLVFSEETVNISVINGKKWTQNQASMFFGTLAKTNFDIEQLSPSVLQGFTCTSVQSMTTTRIQRLIRACRPRRGRAKVVLKESQLTCMYNLLNGDISQNFTDYPSDMLLYLNNKDVKRANCRSYISALGAADFSVASSVLNKDSLLLNEARTCLGIKGLNLSRDNVEVLGNMACTLNSSYIQNADPLILEKLKACKDFSGSQVAAMETLLLSGKTPYGNVKTWNQRTLENLGILPLYFTRNIWGQLTTGTKRRFLRTFMPHLRKTKTEKRKLKGLFKEITALKIRRGAGCTVGNITQVTVSVTSFPFGYDQTQFDLCLDVPVLKNNLNSICEKVDDDEFQKIILKKLNQAFPSGVSDNVVQVLGSVSRVASLEDISKWNITTADTLAALMKADDGSWEAAKSKAIISKYLNTSGNTLGSTELNSIDSNLCSLNTSTLKTVSPDSIRNSNPLNVASCSSEQKRVLYEISNTSFSSQRASPTTFYNLIKTYIGGAPLSDVKALSTQNINMDVGTFRSLDPNVIADLTVTDVQGLMGSQLQDLKVFENDPVIQSWVSRQVQSDLDRLGLNLTTNRSNLTTSPPSFTSNTNAITSASTTASPSSTSKTNGTTSTSGTASPSPPSNTNAITSASTTASPSFTSKTNGTTSTSGTASPSPPSNTNAITSASTTASPSFTSKTNGTTSTSGTASPSPPSNTNAITSASTTASPSFTSKTNGTTSTSGTASPSPPSNTNAITSASTTASPSFTSKTNGTTSTSGTASPSPPSNTNAITSASTTASPSFTSKTNGTTSTSGTASPSPPSNTNAITSASTTASPSFTSKTNGTTSTSGTASPSPPSNTNAITSTSAAASPSSTSKTNATTSVSASASTVTATQGNTSGSDATLTTTVTTTDTSTTSGGTELAKYSTSIFLAALLTTVLQIQQLT
uniref:Mesothelin a n=1 Tax=Seriola dumerili TaxID=41447 RepID=A0A3B4UJM2_SERDU